MINILFCKADYLVYNFVRVWFGSRPRGINGLFYANCSVTLYFVFIICFSLFQKTLIILHSPNSCKIDALCMPQKLHFFYCMCLNFDRGFIVSFCYVFESITVIAVLSIDATTTLCVSSFQVKTPGTPQWKIWKSWSILSAALRWVQSHRILALPSFIVRS